ncbi:hypothetical protein N0V82_002850 [Gnomoniopsis sp. IMI 355080]|nr:hypothetical protein N0V82_002850 [Gnomoniopsis sp. IMI 355080]
MAEPVCKVCADPLRVPVSDDDEPGPSSSSANTIPDDLLFPCGCHYHWQCALDQASHIATHLTCPSCDSHLVSNTPGPSVTNPIYHTSQAAPSILCRYESDGGVEENYDILPVLTEEAYLETHPNERRNRAFLTMCGEGDVIGAVELLKDAASEGEDVRAIILYRDSLANGKSALQIALEKQQEEAVWLLLYLGSPRLPIEAFPDEAIAAAQSMGVDRMPPGGEDIVSLRDEGGRSAEDYARAVAPVWDRLVQAGVLRP